MIPYAELCEALRQHRARTVPGEAAMSSRVPVSLAAVPLPARSHRPAPASAPLPFDPPTDEHEAVTPGALSDGAESEAGPLGGYAPAIDAGGDESPDATQIRPMVPDNASAEPSAESSEIDLDGIDIEDL